MLYSYAAAQWAEIALDYTRRYLGHADAETP
jgi:hypothetical protein